MILNYKIRVWESSVIFNIVSHQMSYRVILHFYNHKMISKQINRIPHILDFKYYMLQILWQTWNWIPEILNKSPNVWGHANVSKRQIATNCFEWSTIFLFVSFKCNTKKLCTSPPPLKRQLYSNDKCTWVLMCRLFMWC